MRKSSTMIVASLIGVLLAGPVLAQPRPYDESDRYQGQYQQNGGYEGDGQYYYNGRWVDSGEWRRHDSERDEWARSYRGRDDYRDNYRRRHHHDDDSSAIAAGIIGFALGAAIVGSQQDAARARRADRNWEASCSRRYRSYDRESRTYLGSDRMRHYC